MSTRPATPLRAASTYCLLPAALSLLLTAGCHNGRQVQHDLYTRELRLQEDEIYRLEDCLEECHQIIRGMRQENQKLKGQLGDDTPAAPPVDPLEGEDGGGERSLLDDLDWSPDRAEPAPVPPAGPDAGEDSVPDIELPNIDGGEPAEAPPFDASPMPTETSPVEVPDVELPGVESIEPPSPLENIPTPGAEEEEAPPFEFEPLSSVPADSRVLPATGLEAEAYEVASVTIDCEPGAPEPTGEPTIVASVRPLSSNQRVTLIQGTAELMMRVADAPAAGELARWRYQTDEVAASWLGMGEEPRLAFALVLPPTAPRDKPLELWVRLVDEEGARFLARTTVTLDELAKAPTVELTAADEKPVQEEVAAAPAPIEVKSTPAATLTPPAKGWTSRTAAGNAHGTPIKPAEGGWRGSASGGSEIRVTGYDEPLR